ncbi:MAG: VOC family protein [Mycobacteriaceae bacterium]|nr:VOC family protein [Mycobacteriaceae bacterium]
MITAMAHTGVCVPDCEAAVAFYRDVLGLRVLSPPYAMDGEAICEDIEATRAELERRGVRFLVQGIADVARVRTTWFVDPWGVVFILVEKSRPERPYFAQR